MVRLIAWSVATVALVGGVLVLRAVTMTRHDDPPPGSETVVEFEIAVVGGAPPEEMASALLAACDTRVDADVVVGSWRVLDDDVFGARLSPALNQFARRELEGCLEDRTLDHVQAVVEELGAARPGGAPIDDEDD
jgi:hypothetical protein